MSGSIRLVTQCHIPEDLELQCEFSSLVLCIFMLLSVSTFIVLHVNISVRCGLSSS
jgi:hypothetical protein